MFQKDMEILKFPISSGWEWNAVGPANGSTPLHGAVWADNLPAIRILLEHGDRRFSRALGLR